jgi:probable phosphoglycerate mutase
MSARNSRESVKSPLIYFIRHGQTEWNAGRRLQGNRDIPLNEAGRGEARRSGEILRALVARNGRTPHDLDYVSSPLVRARETMELIRAALGLDPTAYRTDPRLAEIGFGTWEGLTLADLKRSAAEQLVLREQDPWHFEPPGGESYEKLTQRIADWHGQLVHDTVICSHLNTGRALMVHLGLSPRRVVPRHPIDQSAVYVFDANGITRHGESLPI